MSSPVNPLAQNEIWYNEYLSDTSEGHVDFFNHIKEYYSSPNSPVLEKLNVALRRFKEYPQLQTFLIAFFHYNNPNPKSNILYQYYLFTLEKYLPFVTFDRMIRDRVTFFSRNIKNESDPIVAEIKKNISNLLRSPQFIQGILILEENNVFWFRLIKELNQYVSQNPPPLESTTTSSSSSSSSTSVVSIPPPILSSSSSS